MSDITGVVLSAGDSTRMGNFKPLLTIGEKTIIERAVALFKDAGITCICAVVGHQRGRIEPILKRAGVRIIINEENSPEMFSSVRAAVNAIGPDARTIVFLPVDVPLVRPWTLEHIIKQYDANRTNILIPTFRGKRGHPVVIPGVYFDGIKKWKGDDGLRGVIRQTGEQIVEVAVADVNILFDIDTPEDYEISKQKWLTYGMPTKEECEAILRDVVCVDPSVYAHCQVVCTIAEKIGRALDQSGYSIDSALLSAAGLLHDLAKGKPNHAQEAARLLTEMGYSDVASAVAVHMDIECSSDQPINCEEVLYLADKLVDGSTVVSVEQRLQRALKKDNHEPEIRKKVERRLSNAVIIKDKVEKIIGRKIRLSEGVF